MTNTERSALLLTAALKLMHARGIGFGLLTDPITGTRTALVSPYSGDWAARLWADRDAERSRRHGKGRSRAASRRRARRGNTTDPVPLDFDLVTKIAEDLQRGTPT